MTNPFPGQAVHDVQFCPYEDLLGVGHAGGFSQLIIPGAGEANYDSLEANPFETRNGRREREINALLDKIQPDQITMDPDLIGKVAKTSKDKEDSSKTPFARKPRLQRLQDSGLADADVDDNNLEGTDGF